MKRRCSAAVFLIVVLCFTTAWADEIVLKNGQRFSGRFIRGDAGVVEFQILGRIESFKTSEVRQILFQEPEMTAPAPTRAPDAVPAKPPEAVSQPSAQPVPVATTADVTFPAGTILTIRTASPIDTDTNKVGDSFSAVLNEPLFSGTRSWCPRVQR